MSYVDLHATLRNWAYDPERISVRKILGETGSVKIQLRVELGVLQMEESGRPDGECPHGFDSLLHYYRHELNDHVTRNGTPLGFALDRCACELLRAEMSQYYRRYVALFVLDEFEGVVRDTEHNLAVMDFCREHALEKADRRCLEAFRPYVLMMNARGHAAGALQAGDPTSALAHVNRGIMHIRSHFEDTDRPEAAEKCEELKLLEELSLELAEAVPENSLVSARKALRVAIEEERFEEAARLRDVIEGFYKGPTDGRRDPPDAEHEVGRSQADLGAP